MRIEGGEKLESGNPNNKMKIVIFLDKSNDEDWLTSRDYFFAMRSHSFTVAIMSVFYQI